MLLENPRQRTIILIASGQAEISKKQSRHDGEHIEEALEALESRAKGAREALQRMGTELERMERKSKYMLGFLCEGQLLNPELLLTEAPYDRCFFTYTVKSPNFEYFEASVDYVQKMLSPSSYRLVCDRYCMILNYRINYMSSKNNISGKRLSEVKIDHEDLGKFSRIARLEDELRNEYQEDFTIDEDKFLKNAQGFCPKRIRLAEISTQNPLPAPSLSPSHQKSLHKQLSQAKKQRLEDLYSIKPSHLKIMGGIGQIQRAGQIVGFVNERTKSRSKSRKSRDGGSFGRKSNFGEKSLRSLYEQYEHNDSVERGNSQERKESKRRLLNVLSNGIIYDIENLSQSNHRKDEKESLNPSCNHLSHRQLSPESQTKRQNLSGSRKPKADRIVENVEVMLPLKTIKLERAHSGNVLRSSKTHNLFLRGKKSLANIPGEIDDSKNNKIQASVFRSNDQRSKFIDSAECSQDVVAEKVGSFNRVSRQSAKTTKTKAVFKHSKENSLENEQLKSHIMKYCFIKDIKRPSKVATSGGSKLKELENGESGQNGQPIWDNQEKLENMSKFGKKEKEEDNRNRTIVDESETLFKPSLKSITRCAGYGSLDLQNMCHLNLKNKPHYQNKSKKNIQGSGIDNSNFGSFPNSGSKTGPSRNPSALNQKPSFTPRLNNSFKRPNSLLKKNKSFGAMDLASPKLLNSKKSLKPPQSPQKKYFSGVKGVFRVAGSAGSVNQLGLSPVAFSSSQDYVPPLHEGEYAGKIKAFINPSQGKKSLVFTVSRNRFSKRVQNE